jgi:hypothetical protein
MSMDNSRGEQLCDDLFEALRELRVDPTGDGPTLVEGVTSRGELIDGQTMGGFLHDAGEALSGSGRVYVMDGSVMFELLQEADRGLVQIATASHVETCAPALLTNVIAATTQSQRGEIQCPVPPKLVHALLVNELFRSRVPCIREYARRPLYDADFILRGPGWHAEPRILVHGQDIAPVMYDPPVDAVDPRDRLPPQVRALLADFCWATSADLANAAGMLLTGLLINHFIDEPHPVVLLDGNQPGVGKTLFARALGVILDGVQPAPIRYTFDEELEKKLCARLRTISSSVLLLDNVRGQIDSPLLEQHVLAPQIVLRILGLSQEIRRRNRYVWCITSNGADPTRDFFSRSLPIRLRYEGDTRARTFAFPDLLGFAGAYRLELLGELAGLVERWRLKGMPAHRRQHRCRRWAAVIGGILNVAGLGAEFLSNVGAAEQEMDRGLAVLTALAEEVLRSGGLTFLGPPGETPKSWVAHIQRVCALPAPHPAERPQASTTRAGQFLSSMVNRSVSVATEQVERTAILKCRKGGGNQNRYWFEFGQPAAETTQDTEQVAPPTSRAPAPRVASLPARDSVAGASPDGAGNHLNWGM